MDFILFKSVENNQWYWQFRTDNQEPIAAGTEGYINKQDALKGIYRVRANAAASPIWDDSQKKYSR